MGQKLLVSVIIPVFNVEPFLEEALSSVISQSYKNLQIIIVDDGSTDNSGVICDSFAERDKRISVIHQDNRGLSAARNVGLNVMTGDYVAFLDSDDAYHPEFISKLISSIVAEEADIAVCKNSIHRTLSKMTQNNREKVVPTICQGIYDRESALRALANGEINHSVWNKLYRGCLWRDIRFPEGHVYEDRATTYLIIDCCRQITVIDEPLYLRRIRPDSITNTFSLSNLNDWLLAQSHFEIYIESHIHDIFTENYLKRNRQVRLNRMISNYLHMSKPGKDKGRPAIENLRNEIIKLATTEGLSHLSFRVKTYYWLISSCPRIIGFLYYGSLPVKRFYKRQLQIRMCRISHLRDLILNGFSAKQTM